MMGKNTSGRRLALVALVAAIIGGGCGANGEPNGEADSLSQAREPTTEELASADLVGDWTVSLTNFVVTDPDLGSEPPSDLVRSYRFACIPPGDDCVLHLEREDSMGMRPAVVVSDVPGTNERRIVDDYGEVEVCEDLEGGPPVMGTIEVEFNFRVTEAEPATDGWRATRFSGTVIERISSPDPDCPDSDVRGDAEGTR